VVAALAPVRRILRTAVSPDSLPAHELSHGTSRNAYGLDAYDKLDKNFREQAGHYLEAYVTTALARLLEFEGYVKDGKVDDARAKWVEFLGEASNFGPTDARLKEYGRFGLEAKDILTKSFAFDLPAAVSGLQASYRGLDDPATSKYAWTTATTRPRK